MKSWTEERTATLEWEDAHPHVELEPLPPTEKELELYAKARKKYLGF